MTASQTLTPSQARYMREHKERRERFAAKAKCLSAPAKSQSTEVTPAVEPALIPSVQAWVERQIRLYEPWFSIESEIEPPPLGLNSMAIIQRICAAYYSILMADMLSERRRSELVRARQVAIFLCKEFTSRSMPEIGRRFGGRDHTTVLHAIRKITRLESQDERLAADLQVLRQRIREAA